MTMEDDLAREVNASKLSYSRVSRHEIIHSIDDHDRHPSTPRRQEHWKTETPAIGKGGQGHVFRQTCIAGSRHHTQRVVKKIPLVQGKGGQKRYMRELRAITRFSRDYVSNYPWVVVD